MCRILPLLLVLVVVGCTKPSVEINPSKISVCPSQSIALNAEVKNTTRYTLKWAVEGPQVSGLTPASYGQLIPAGQNSVLYRAPPTPPHEAIKVTATVYAETEKVTDQATVDFLKCPGGVGRNGDSLGEGVQPSDFYDALIISRGTFALDRKVDETGGYRVKTYLPQMTRLFLENASPTLISPKGKVGAEQKQERYLSIITQHGQRLLVLESEVSEKRFVDNDSRKDIAYHQDSYMCPEDDKNCRAYMGTRIRGGEVVSLLKKESNDDYVRLRKVDSTGNFLGGYLSRDLFVLFEYENILTDMVKYRSPKYQHENTKRYRSLGTRCSQVKENIDIESLKMEMALKVDPLTIVPWLRDAFSISGSLEKGVERKTVTVKKYGGEGIATAHWGIVISEPDENGQFIDEASKRHFYVTAEVKCVGAAGEEDEIFIKEMTIKEIQDGKKNLVGILRFNDFYPSVSVDSVDANSPPFKIFENNNHRSFLTSINSWKDYYNAIRVWQMKVKDVSLASILMGEFNATCPGWKEFGKVLRVECYEALQIKGLLLSFLLSL